MIQHKAEDIGKSKKESKKNVIFLCNSVIKYIQNNAYMVKYCFGNFCGQIINSHKSTITC